MKRRRMEFSKVILLFETALVAFVSWRVLAFVELAIRSGFTGGLPYLTTFITAVWAAYGGSVGVYQNKSGKENVKKIEAAGAANCGQKRCDGKASATNPHPDCD